jgi:hypothetical protein
MNNQISSKTIALTFGVLVILFSAGFYIFAWQEPASAPPAGNMTTPLNTSATAQTKTGDLTIGISQIKADGSVGTNLNSDKVDDYHAADLMAAGGSGLFELSCGWIVSVGGNSVPSVGSCTPIACPTGYVTSGISCSVDAIGGQSIVENGAAGYFYGQWAAGGRCYRVCYK